MAEIAPGICDLCMRSLKEIKNHKKNEVDFIQLRLFISTVRKFDKENVILSSDKYSHLLKLILEILASGILSPDSETLLSTAFCVLVKSTSNHDVRCELLSECMSTKNTLNLSLNCQSGPSHYPIVIQDGELLRVCLAYSILQCFEVESLLNFYISNSTTAKKSPFSIILDVLENSCSKFTKLTCLSFKLLVLWLQRLRDLFYLKFLDYSHIVLHLKKVILIVNSNWENPVAGVRDKNVEITKLVFDILPQSNDPKYAGSGLLFIPYLLETTLQQLPWRMKCKYVILAAVLSKFGVKKALHKFSYIPSGLVFSLSFPHLVSAGTDLYREILREIRINDWLHFFLGPFKSLIFGSDKVAKQNLMSHWMPETLKAYPPVIDELLTDLMSDINSLSLFPLLALLKIGKKNGILNWEQMDQKLILGSLSHSCEEVRAEVFTILCVSTKTTLWPSQDEINMVCTFLEDNINADSSKLRQVMVCSFKKFICRLKDCFTTRNNVSSGNGSEDGLKNLFDFILWLQNFIICNYEPGANYQRRISSLHLLKTILDNLSGKATFESKGLQYNNCSRQETLLKKEIDICFKGSNFFSILLRCLIDPAVDIRDAASYILKAHFKLPSEDLFPVLWEKALNMCDSSMFYEIESGAVIAEVLMHWTLSQQTREANEEVFPFFEVLLSRAEEQQTKLEENLLKGAMEGPVHGILNILHRMISSPDILIHLKMKEIHVNRLLHLIDGLTSFVVGVLSSKANTMTNVAPSFAEMEEAIECTITKNVEGLDDIEIEKLTGAHELVLNCIWLNLKMCCLVASALAAPLSQGRGNAGPFLKEGGVEYCAQLVIRVLMKCRHKGAIESAGKALSILALFCAKNTNPKIRELPVKLLTDYLETTLGRSCSSERASITRRSAGLAILVQKLVTADAKNTVPACVPKLLSWAEMNDMTAFINIETEDLPQTQALHFLRVIVQDPAAYQYISPYMSEIALVCFKNFSSGIWAIRNAALQLFGAVVPKLVGQKKVQEEDIVGSNVTVEELTVHYPELMDFLLKELKGSVENITNESDVMSSTLLPILALCSRLTIGMSQLHTDSFKRLLSEFQSLFSHFLSSPIIAIRKSCAKAMSAFTPLSQLPEQVLFLMDSLKEKWPHSENEQHGKLLCIKILRDRLEMDSYLIPESTVNFEKVQKHIIQMDYTSSVDKMSFFTRALFNEIQGSADKDISLLVITTKNNVPSGWYPGLALWTAVSVDLIMLSCPEDNICSIMQQCFQCSSSMLEASLIALMKRIKLNIVMETNKVNIFKQLVALCDLNLSINIMIHCLNSILQLSTISIVSLSMEKLKGLYIKFVQSSSYGIGCSAIALSLISCLIMRSKELRNQSDLTFKVVITIKERSSPKCLEDYRLQAARALFFSIPIFNQQRDMEVNKETNINNEIVTCLLDSAILLLQDENLNVRKEAARFVSNLNTPKYCAYPQIIFNPQSCIKLLFTGILQLLPLKTALEFLWGKLTNEHSVSDLKNHTKFNSIRNPFDHGVSNIYAEDIKITQIAAETLLTVINMGTYDLGDFKSLLSDNISKIVQEATALISLLRFKELGDEFHLHAEVYRTLKNIKYQIEVAVSVRIEGFEDLKPIVSQLEMGSIKMLNII